MNKKGQITPMVAVVSVFIRTNWPIILIILLILYLVLKAKP